MVCFVCATRMQGDALRRTILVEAISAGDSELCREMLKGGLVDEKTRSELVNRADDKKDSPLTLAVWNGHVPIVQLLLECKADVHQRQGTGHTSLMLIAGREYPKAHRAHRATLANLLLTAGADVNARDNEGRTVLHVAATLGDNELVARLVQHPQLQVNLPDKKKDSALTLAVWHGHTSVCELLLQAKADPNHRQATGHTALLLLICLAYPEALRSHRLTLFRLLVAFGADLRARVEGDLHRTVLAEVCANGDVELCREVLKHVPKTDDKARYELLNRADDKKDCPLTLAVWNGHLSIVELLVEAKCDGMIDIGIWLCGAPLDVLCVCVCVCVCVVWRMAACVSQSTSAKAQVTRR
jgi:ankyrin repeat protein